MGNFIHDNWWIISPPAYFAKKYLDDRDDYQALQRWSELPIVGRIARSRMDQLTYSENQRYWYDYKRNTGINPRYPIRSGLYGSYSSEIGEAFEATEAVMSLYGRFKRY